MKSGFLDSGGGGERKKKKKDNILDGSFDTQSERASAFNLTGGLQSNVNSGNGKDNDVSGATHL